MKIISWNVNGVRAVLKKGLLEFINKNKPDILCLQEIKISANTLLTEKIIFPGYQVYWHSAQRPGYSGTAILVKNELVSLFKINNGFGLDKFDQEGRVQVLESPDFYLLNTYFPNANPELSRLAYKLEFNEAILSYIKELELLKPVIITGDFNVAHQEIDLARPKENVNSPGFTADERASFDKFIKSGLIDTFRFLNGEKIQYSWWSFRTAARSRNIGWRIDYFCVSAKLKKHLTTANILDTELGSDHAPVVLELNTSIKF